MAKSTSKSETEPVTTLVVATDKEKLQEQLRLAMAKIDEKLSELEGTKSVSKTQATIPANIHFDEWNTSTGVVAVHASQDIPTLLKLASRIRMHKREYDETAELLGLKQYPVFVWNGVSADAILSFLEARIKTVSNATKITQLKADRKKLETFLSEEDRLASTLQSISNTLKD